MRWNLKSGANTMQLRKKGEVPYFVFPNLEDTHLVRHGFSTRLGGVSEGHLSCMNLSFTRGDEKERVEENFRRMADAIGFPVESMVMSQQTHTTNVRLVTEEDRGKGYTRPLDYDHIDGLITNVPGLTLVTFYADCVPLFFVDPVRGAIGLSHSGWRGTVRKIGKKTVEEMKKAFGTDPKDVHAAIGPSICQDCYEVSEDVIGEFRKAFPGIEEGDAANSSKEGVGNGSLRSEVRKRACPLWFPTSPGKYQLNLWEVNRLIMLEAGIPAAQIEMTDVCTCCNPDLLFSHRASHGKRGNLGAFMKLL